MIMTSSVFRKLAVAASLGELLGVPFSLLSLVRASDDADDDLDGDDVAASSSGGAIVLSDDSFKSELEKANSAERGLFIKFYAPWCGHCKRMAGMWEELADEMNGKASACLVAKLDSTAENGRSTSAEFAIKGFPTLKMVKGDVMYEYEGSRSPEALKKFCEGDYSSAKSSALPWNQSFMDKVKKYLGEYLEKMGQVHGYEPTLLPLIFMLGAMLGLMLGTIIAGSSTVSPTEEPVAKNPAATKGASDKKKD